MSTNYIEEMLYVKIKSLIESLFCGTDINWEYFFFLLIMTWTLEMQLLNICLILTTPQ